MPNLGATRLSVTRIGLGLAALGRPGYINIGHGDDLKRNYDIDAMTRRAHDVLDAAWALGIRYFDVARSYGRAEAFLGSWLRSRVKPGDVTVGSKWGYTYTADWRVDADAHEVKSHTKEVLLKQWSESTATLGSYLDLYQIHSVTLESGVLSNGDVLCALGKLKEEGVHIGLTLSGSNQGSVLERAVEIEIDGVRLFETVQATWNVLEPSAGANLAAAKELGLGVIVKEALANGRLTHRGGDNEGQSLLKSEAARFGTTVDAVALAAVLNQPWVDVVLSGAATVDQLRSNVGALDVEWSAETANRLAGLAESPQRYWKMRSELPWN